MLEPSNLNLLLIDAPVGRHLAQLHKDKQARVEAVSVFVEEGLRRGNGVVVVTSSLEADHLLERLSMDRLDPEVFRRSGQFVIHDAEVLLGQFMKGGMPDWGIFRRTMGSVLDKVEALGYSTARVYGDMVDILWQQGQVQAAIRLEELWNDFGRMYPFSLFCSYMYDNRDESFYKNPLHEIGRTHTDIVVSPDDEMCREVMVNAIRDIFGMKLSEMLHSESEEIPGEDKLPDADRAVLWILKNRSTRLVDVLDRIRAAQ